MKRFGLICSALFVLFLMPACGEKDADAEENNGIVAEKKISYNNDLSHYPTGAGLAGLFDVPEMLSISIMDSAAMHDVAEKVKRNYGLLAKDIEAVGAQPDGPPLQISYNNDPENFKFECLLLIKEMPAKTPEHSKIVVLEASKMLLYNYYGPYQDLFNAYAEIGAAIDSLKLEQTGAVREFYVTEPALETDEKKWLTRVFVPVSQAAK